MVQEVGSRKRKGQGIIHYKFNAQGQTVNQECYSEVLTRLCESFRKKIPELWPDKWILHHDSSPVHDSLRVREFLDNKSITKIHHPRDSTQRFLALFNIKRKFQKGTKIF
jgi:hypothetical protein